MAFDGSLTTLPVAEGGTRGKQLVEEHAQQDSEDEAHHEPAAEPCTSDQKYRLVLRHEQKKKETRTHITESVGPAIKPPPKPAVESNTTNEKYRFVLRHEPKEKKHAHT